MRRDDLCPAPAGLREIIVSLTTVKIRVCFGGFRVPNIV
jgi:hypothetical protein